MTSADHPNARRFHEAYTLWFSGTPAPLLQMMADDVVYHLPGKHLGGGDLHGRDAIIARARSQASSFDEPARTEILDVIANDEFVVSFERFRAVRHGNALDQVICGVWRLQDGRVAELWTHFEDQATCDAFWE